MSARASAGRSADLRQRNPMIRSRSVIAAMYAGLATTVIAAIIPYVDRVTSNTLADHIRAGYPTYPQARIDTASSRRADPGRQDRCRGVGRLAVRGRSLRRSSKLAPRAGCRIP